MPIKPIKKITSINPEYLEDIRTGEPIKKMFDSSSSIRVTKVEESTRSEVHSTSYIIFDSNAAEYIQDILTDVEYAKTIKMAQEVSAPYNVLKRDKKEHTSTSLQQLLGLSKSKFYALVRNLVKKGILAYAVCAPAGIVKKVYILNPTIARRSKDFENAILALFPDLS